MFEITEIQLFRGGFVEIHKWQLVSKKKRRGTCSVTLQAFLVIDQSAKEASTKSTVPSLTPFKIFFCPQLPPSGTITGCMCDPCRA